MQADARLVHGDHGSVVPPREMVHRSESVQVENIGNEKFEQMGVTETGGRGSARADESSVQINSCSIANEFG